MKSIECKKCHGEGYIEYICDECNGSGEGYKEGTTCSKCKGSGAITLKCTICEGKGYIDKRLDIDFELPENLRWSHPGGPNLKLNIMETGNQLYCFSIVNTDTDDVYDQIVLTYDLLKRIMKVIDNNEKELNQLMNLKNRIREARKRLIEHGVVAIDGSGDPYVEDLFRIIDVILKDLNKEEMYK